jgi:hypothetical protein
MPRGGKRNNAGAPKGTVQRRSLEKAAVARAFRERTMKQADNLFNAQLAKAVGSIMVFRIDEEMTAAGKTKRVHTHITDPDEIKRVLDETSATGEGTVNGSYYFVTDIPPDNKAIDSMLDRAFGKAVQSIEVNDVTENKAVQMAQDLYASLLGKGFAEALARQFVKERYQIDEILITESVS